MNTAEIQPQALSITDTTKRLSIGKTHLYSLIASEQLESFRLGKKRLVTTSSIDALIERQCAIARTESLSASTTCNN